MTKTRLNLWVVLLACFVLGHPSRSMASGLTEAEARRLDALRVSAEPIFRLKEFTAGCVPHPFPTTPAGPTYTGVVVDNLKAAALTIWRVPCAGGDAQTLVTFEPRAGDPFVCSARVTLLQEGRQIDSLFLSRHPTSIDSLCSNLFVTTTVWLRPASSATPFDDDAAFTFLYEDSLSTGRTEVPAYNPAQYGGTPSFAVSSKLAGTWYVAAMPGQGWFFDVHDASKQFVMSWFTWTSSASGHDWYTGLGSFSGDRATLTLYRSSGGRFATPQTVSTTSAGTAQISFASCTAGTLTYSFEDGRTGTLPIVRLTEKPPGC